MDPLLREAEASGGYKKGLAALRDAAFLETTKYSEQRLRADFSACDYRICEFERKFMKRMAKLQIPMFCSEARRSPTRQNQLYIQGRSKAKGGQSPHQHGFAVDLIHSIKGWDLTSAEWTLVGHVGKEVAKAASIKLQWGGDWKFYDPAHWELDDWRNQALQISKP